MSSALAKDFAGICKTNLQRRLPARRKELEQQHPSKAATLRTQGVL